MESGRACGAVVPLSGGDGVQFRALEGDRITERGAGKSGPRVGEDWGVGGGVSWESQGTCYSSGALVGNRGLSGEELE